MASSHIPNLNTLRNPNRPGRAPDRRRGNSGNASCSSVEDGRLAKDKIVQHTDQDASVSRLSAVEIGYLDDPFAKLFVSAGEQRRFPIINRGILSRLQLLIQHKSDRREGTYVRTTVIDNLVRRFLSDSAFTKKQIISLGAGSDTRFFRLTAQFAGQSLVYHELDFPVNTSAKISFIDRSRALSDCIHGPLTVSSDGTALHSLNYHIHPFDLRTLHPPGSSPSDLPPPEIPYIDPSLPTLLISECCLIYLAPAAADAVVNYFAKHLFAPSTPLGVILYEPINPSDAFGKVMVSNLAQRGIVLQTLRRYGSLEAQMERMRAHGFSGKGGADVKRLWETGVNEVEKERISCLEMMDEVEEWNLLASHYCVIWGWRGGEDKETWRLWDELPRQE